MNNKKIRIIWMSLKKFGLKKNKQKIIKTYLENKNWIHNLLMITKFKHRSSSFVKIICNSKYQDQHLKYHLNKLCLRRCPHIQN